MSGVFGASLDIFFIAMMGLLYVAFVFFAKNLTSKFFIFFISSFINIFNYSIVLNNEYSFLTVVLLNIIFILIIVVFYIYSSLEHKNLPQSFMESSDIKNLITIVIFTASFVILCSIFLSLNAKKDLFKTGFNNNSSILTVKKIYNIENKRIQKKEMFTANGYNFVIYNRNINFIEKNNIFMNYNLLIILYVSIVIVVFFISNKRKEDKK